MGALIIPYFLTLLLCLFDVKKGQREVIGLAINAGKVIKSDEFEVNGGFGILEDPLEPLLGKFVRAKL